MPRPFWNKFRRRPRTGSSRCRGDTFTRAMVVSSCFQREGYPLDPNWLYTRTVIRLY
jgi:hypothetical protein